MHLHVTDHLLGYVVYVMFVHEYSYILIKVVHFFDHLLNSTF